MKIIHSVTWFITIFAAFNCGIIGLFDFDLVKLITTDPSMVRIIYTIFGVSVVWYLYEDFNNKD